MTLGMHCSLLVFAEASPGLLSFLWAVKSALQHAASVRLQR